MTPMILYCVAVITLLILYYLYKPNNYQPDNYNNKQERKNSNNNSNSNSNNNNVSNNNNNCNNASINQDNEELERLKNEPINANDLILLTKQQKPPPTVRLSIASIGSSSASSSPQLIRKRKNLSISESVPLEKTSSTTSLDNSTLSEACQTNFESINNNHRLSFSSSFIEKFKVITKFYYYYYLHKYLIQLCKYMGLNEPFENNNLNKYAKYRKTLSSTSSSSFLFSSSIEDNNYKSIDEILNELNKLVINNDDSVSFNNYNNKFNCIIGIDLTASNEWKGRKTFNSQSLHKTLGDKLFNPYQRVIGSIAFTLNRVLSNNVLLNSFCSSFINASDSSSVNFNSSGHVSSNNQLVSLNNFYRIHAFGFGDSVTKDKHVFSFSDSNLFTPSSLINLDLNSFDSFDDLLIRYNETIKRIRLSGPTNFAPIIYTSIDIIRYQQIMFSLPSSSSSSSSISSLISSFYMLFIITDGKLTAESERETLKALQMASNYPLCVICVGVGDGPWHTIAKLEHNLSYYVNNKFDNFMFIDYHELINKHIKNASIDSAFALKALSKLPKQFKDMRSLNFI